MNEENGQNDGVSPLEKGKNKWYGKPPVEHQIKPGEVRNPKGRGNAGATIREYINALATAELTEDELRKIGRDRKQPWTRRAAAERILRTIEAPDLSDFGGLLRGENQIEDLRAMGINTEVVKKFKQKTRKVPTGGGEVEEVIEREIELYDRAGDDFDRVCDRTDGKPHQTLGVKMDVSQRDETREMMKNIYSDPAMFEAARAISAKVNGKRLPNRNRPPIDGESIPRTEPPDRS